MGLMGKITVTVSILLSLLFCFDLQAQSKMDLEDVQIKGELHNDDRLRIMARERNRLKNFVKYRTNFRNEIVEGLPRPKPRVKY